MRERRVAVVVDDDEDVRGLLAAVLVQSGFDVHEAGSGSAGVQLVGETDPDVVTLDLGLPDIDGFEAARRIRCTSDAHIVMVTARTDEINTVLGLESGADAYLTKPFRPRELRARVDAIMRRRADRQPSTASAPADRNLRGAVVENEAPRTVSAPVAAGGGGRGRLELNGLVLDGAEVQLTPTEFFLLQSILAGKRTVRTKSSLARRLRHEDADAGTVVSSADERSIAVHVGNLRRKLGDNPKAPRWIETVRGVGYRSAPAR
ncbi:response regulator transcription factor [Arthrobacter sp. JSM 101049]|uniref:response regulator transcription factor n=1 Tax=Arthrobacter sp. JSM 101049 TaxID=929097 RepID=UPI003564CD90